MKVIQICNYFADFKGSFINQLELLADKIKRSGGQCTFIFPKQAKELLWCTDLQMRHKIYFVSCINWRTRNVVKKELISIFNIEKPNLIHSHFDGYDVSISKVSPFNSVQIYHRHNEFDVSNLTWYKKLYALAHIKYKMYYLRNGGYSIFISEDMYSEFLSKQYVKKEKAKIIFNGISTFSLENHKVTFKIFDKKVVFSLIGNWHRKGGDIIFEAIKTINENENKVILACLISDERLNKIKKDNKTLPTWLVPLRITNNIEEYFSFADLFISASRKETFSYALAEAVYFGLPCISSDINGVQWSKELKSVRFFESENIKALIKEIEFSLVNEIDNSVLVNDKETIKNKFSDNVWCINILSFYNEIIKLP